MARRISRRPSASISASTRIRPPGTSNRRSACCARSRAATARWRHSAIAWAASSPISPQHGPASRPPSAIMGSASRTISGKPRRSRSRCCCISRATTTSCPPRRWPRSARPWPSFRTFESYVYPGTDHAFNCKERPSYDRPASGMAYSRSIAFLRRHLGPHYDLSTLWDLHTMYEFGTRDVEATMKTMVAQPLCQSHPDHDRWGGRRPSSRGSIAITSSRRHRRTPS